MLVVADNLSTFTLGAGEPFLLQVEFQDKDGAPVDLGARAFVLSVYRQDRSVVQQLAGVRDSDSKGPFLRFEEDGAWSEGLFGIGGLKVELAELYLRGSNRIATGTLTIKATAASVPSLGSASIGAYAIRIVVKNSAALGGEPTFSQHGVPYIAQGATPTPAPGVPVFTTPPSISPATGTAGVTTFTASDGAASNASGYTRRWLLSGTVIGTGGTIKPSAAGSLVLEVTAHGPGGDSEPRPSAAAAVEAASVAGARLAFSAPLSRGVAAAAGTKLVNRTPGSTFTTTIAGLTIDNATGAVTGTPTTRSGLVVERLSNGKTRNNLLFVLDAGPRTMQAGMNLGTPSTGTPNTSFLDYMKVAQPDVLPATVDANGVPQTLNPDANYPSIGKASYKFPIDDGRTTPVKLCLLTDGDIDARIDFGPGADFVMDGSGHLVATWPFGGAAQGNEVRLNISRINPNQKPTYINLVNLSELALFNSNTTKGYKQSWIDYLKQFYRLRSMDWFTTNQTMRIDPGSSAMSYYRIIDEDKYRFCCPLERFVDLCLVAGVRMWCNLHATVTDAQWQAMFPQLRRLTAVGKPPVVEWSNEVWNGGFWQSGYATSHFDTLGVTIDNPNAKGQYYNGYRSAQLAKLSRGEGFLHAVGTQPGYEYAAPYIDQGLAKAGGSWSDFAYWTTTFYADGDWGRQVPDITAARRSVQDAIVAAQDFDAAFDITCNYRGPTSTSIEVVKGQMAESKANADARGLKLVGYEGNATSYLSGGDPSFGTRDPFYTGMTTHPLAASVTRAVLDAANEVGMVEAMFFHSDGAPPNSQNGNYAALGRPSVDGILSFTARPAAASTTAPSNSGAQPAATTPLAISGTGYSFDTAVKKFGAASLSLDGSAGWSITGVKPPASGSFSVGLSMRFSDVKLGVAITQESCFWLGQVNGNIEVYYGAGNASVHLSGTSIRYDDDAWHYAELDLGEGGGTLYIDGNAVATSNTSATAAGCDRTTNSLSIGRFLSTTNYGYRGYIDDVAVFTGLRGGAVPQAAFADNAPGLLAHYSLDGS